MNSDKEAAGPTATDSVEPPTTTEALKLLQDQARNFRQQLSLYLDAKSDGIRLRVRSGMLWAGLLAVGFVALAGFMVAAICLMLSGIAGGLGTLLGSRPWMGNMVTGALALSGMGLAMH